MNDTPPEHDELEIPDFDLTEVSTKRLCPAPGIYMLKVTNVDVAAGAKDKTTRNLVVTAEIQGEVMSLPDELGVTKPMENVEVTAYYPLQQPAPKPGKKKSDYDFRTALAEFTDAIEGTTTGSRPAKPQYREYVGQIGMGEITTETDPKFGDRPRLQKWLKQG